MTYLHDYIAARDIIRKEITPKLIAAMMPILDQLGLEYQMLFENQPGSEQKVDALIIQGIEGLPEKYFMRLDFYPRKQAEWILTPEKRGEAGF